MDWGSVKCIHPTSTILFLGSIIAVYKEKHFKNPFLKKYKRSII